MKRLLAVLILLVGLSATAWAQPESPPVTTLRIHDGDVYVDDRRVPADELPPSLDVTGVDADLRFTGAVSPVLRLDGVSYVVRDGGLHEQASEDRVPLEAGPSEPAARRALAPPVIDLSAGMKEGVLSDQEKLQQVKEAQQRQVLYHQQAHAEYLRQVQEASQALYQRLSREQQLEVEMRRLAFRIRGLAPGSDERHAQVRELRSLLDEAFELKMENREREITQLEEELEKLDRQLQERRRLRDEIIQRRLEELVGSDAEPRPTAPGEAAQDD